DARTYTHAATSLLGLGLSRVRLLTNNPDKVAALTAAGIAVTAVPLATTPLSDRAAQYLEAKRQRRGPWIPTDTSSWGSRAARLDRHAPRPEGRNVRRDRPVRDAARRPGR